MYTVTSTEVFDSQYAYWQHEDPNKISKINDLIKNCCETPYKGIGKPKPLTLVNGSVVLTDRIGLYMKLSGGYQKVCVNSVLKFNSIVKHNSELV